MDIDVEQIKEALAPLAEKLGQGAEFAYEVIVRQVYVSAAGYFIASVVSAIIAIAGVKWLLLAANKEEGKRFSDAGMFRSFASFVGAVGLVFSSAFLYDAAARVINPHFYAIHLIFKSLTNTAG